MGKRSEELYRRALAVIPGGTNDPLRITGKQKIAFARADGSHVWDVEGKDYVDCHLSFGPLILGHRHPKVVSSVLAQLEQGDIWNAGLNELEVEVAEKIAQHVPSAERVRFCVSGSDGIMFSLRLARAHTGRRKIMKFIGGYHGTNDSVLVDVSPKHSGNGRSPEVESAGLDPGVAKTTVTVPFNDVEAVERAFAENRDEIAALVTEPVMHSAVGCILPREDFLKSMREITERSGALLIFDEVITGFRHALGGAQSLFGVTPDISVIAKAVANGFPIAAICGGKEVMSEFAPVGKVAAMGTYIAHPISLAAAKATISVLESDNPYERMSGVARDAANGIEEAMKEEGIEGHVARFRSIIMPYFTSRKITSYADLAYNNMEFAREFKEGLLANGVLTLPLPVKRMHFSAVHTESDVKAVVEASRRVLGAMKSGTPKTNVGLAPSQMVP
ncbi:MAG TPA: aspartate aminotransferase family protein [Nitrososphaerales archaeon]